MPDRVISVVALVMAGFLQRLRETIPGINIVYDEKLTYESAVKQFRAKNQSDGVAKDMYPLLAFRRSTLAWSRYGLGKRSTGLLGKQKLPINNQNKTLANLFKILHAEFTFEFLYITRNAKDIEEFEVMFLSREGIPSITETTLDLGEAGGSWDYFIQYPEPAMEDLQFESDGKYYKMPKCTARFFGFFPVFRGQSPLITSIRTRIEDFTSAVYADRTYQNGTWGNT